MDGIFVVSLAVWLLSVMAMFPLAMENPTPVYDQEFSAKGPDDGCDSNSVKFDSDGQCYPLRGREPCSDPRQWVTVDPKTFKGRCTPRLCGRDRVFVARTGLCHDIYDKSECTGGRRLYYSPYGDPVCGCPIGSYPYPNPRDDCVPLFTQGPCPNGQVITMMKELQCVDISDPLSSYYSSEVEKQLIDSGYNSIQHENQVKSDEDKKKKTRYYRQYSGTAIQHPDIPVCAPGSGKGKCKPLM
uniref:DUF4789 domain-containing protein n=1 Tax=Daphnia galeata TaxID=27404 RepID=A0A8J2RRY8_9CRUS|nr:unnamed protein product [Daphnia galeata]